MSTFPVYKVAYRSGTLRTRYGLFVETEDSTGYFIHVFGDVQRGMEYSSGDSDWGIKVENIDGFMGKKLIGTVEEEKLMGFMDTCETVVPPWRQLDNLGRKIDKNKPLYRDEEWVEEVEQRLKDTKLLQII